MPTYAARGDDSREETVKRKPLTDKAIANGLQEHFAFDDVLQFRKLTVEVNEGIARLRGDVASLFEKNRAASLAGTLRGVRAVVNEVRIKPTARDDAEIREAVRDALSAAPATKIVKLSVQVDNGHVTLAGTADSYAEKVLAREVSGTVRGVTKVSNEIAVQAKDKRPDEALQTEIKRRLQSDLWVTDDLIRVEVADGKVTLRGVVGNVAEKRVAELDAYVAGVKEVDVSELVVDSDATHVARRARKISAPKLGEAVDAVKDALRYDPRVSSEDIHVKLEAGVIQLTGTVGTLAAKQAAEQDALRTRHVASVDNQLEIRAATPSQEGAAKATIGAALARDVYVSESEITVAVADGVATLTGTAVSRVGKTRAAKLAEEAPGISSVDNQLRIATKSKPRTDLEIKYGISNRLYWNPVIDEIEVTVIVVDGEATLTGEVDDRSSFDAASRAAREAGANRIHNRLLIRELPGAAQ